MGCRLCKGDVKEALDTDVKVDGKIGNGKEEGFTALPEPSTLSMEKLGMTAKQIFNLRQSWKGIKRNMEETGVEIFVRLFKVDAGLKNMFQALKHLESDDEMRSDEALESHATMVMTTLDDAITHIDNFDYVSEVLRKTGASHVRFDGFKTENFFKIREPFLEAVKITLGDRYTENMESIYKIAITFILQTMAEGMQDAINEESVDGDGS